MITTVPCTGYPLVDCAEKDDTDSISLRGARVKCQAACGLGVNATCGQSDSDRRAGQLAISRESSQKAAPCPYPQSGYVGCIHCLSSFVRGVFVNIRFNRLVENRVPLLRVEELQ